MKECDWCFNEFMPRNRVHKYCSNTCSERARLNKKRSCIREQRELGNPELWLRYRERENERRKLRRVTDPAYKAKQQMYRRNYRNRLKRSQRTEGLTIYG